MARMSLASRRVRWMLISLGLLPIAAAAQSPGGPAGTAFTDSSTADTPSADQRLEPIEVRASPYNVSSESTATKSDLPAAASPFSVDIVPRHLFDDKGALSMEEVLENVGAHAVDASGWGAKSFFLRGFQVDNYYVDGVKQALFTQIDPAVIQQIDVLRGAAGSLYGRIEPGGVINVTTVSPQAKPLVTAEESLGSCHLTRTLFDATGPVQAGAPLLYRLTTVYQSNDSYRDYVFNRHLTIAPSLALVPSASDRIDLKLLYQRFVDANDSGLPLVPVAVNSVGVVTQWRILDAPGSLHVGPIDSAYHAKTTSIVLSASHALNDNWSLKPILGWYRLDQPGSEGGYTADISQPNGDYTGWRNQPANGWGGANPTLADIYVGNPSNFYQRQRFAELDLNGKFSTFDLKHELLVSAEYFDFYYSYQVWQSSVAPNPIDISNPVYQSVNVFYSPPDPRTVAFGNTQKDHWTSVTLQDQISYSDRIRTVLGLRYDRSTTSLESPTGSCAGWYCGYSDSRLTPRLGINVDLSRSIASYASYAKGYGVNDFYQLYDGSLSKSQTSTQYEIGLKGHWFNDRLVARATAFDLYKRNIVVSVPKQQIAGASCVAYDYTGNECYVQLGEDGSRGLEFQIEGRLTDRVSVNVYYETIDAKVLNGGDALGSVSYPVGNHLPDVAPRAGSFWVQYDDPAGWGLAGGANGLGSRPFVASNTLTVPGAIEWDIGANYRWKVGSADLRAQLNIKNLANSHNEYDGNWSGSSLIPGPPRTFLVSMVAKWR